MSEKQTAKKVGIAAIILSVSILASRILGFGREAVVLYMYGASESTDAYYAAFTLPDLMSYFLAGGTLSITFIPLFSSFVTKADEQGGWRLFSIVATTFGCFLAVCIAVAFGLAPNIVPAINPGFDSAEQIDLAVLMTRIVLPAQLFFYFGGLLNATLFVRETFWPAAIAPLIYNVCIIVGGVALSPWFGIEGFAIGVLIGAILGPFGMPLFASRKAIKFRPVIDLRDPGFQKFVLLSLPLMFGVGLVTVDDWLLKYFGSQTDGAISWLSNGRKMMMVCFAVIGQAAGQAALPYLTRLFHEGDEEGVARLMTTSLRRVLFLATLASTGLIVAASPIVFVVFQRGAFSAEDAHMTALLLSLFALGLPGWAAQTFAARGFYARKDTLTPMITSTVVVAIAAPIYWALFGQLGIPGLAAASSVGIVINATVTLVVYQWRVGGIRIGEVIRGCLGGLAIGGLGAAAAWSVATFAPWPESMNFWWWLAKGSSMGVAFLVAVSAVALTAKPEDLWFVYEKVLRRIR